MAIECAVCYSCDINFLLPSVVSAISLRKFVPSKKADIFIFAVDTDEAIITELNRMLAPRHIFVMAMKSSLYTGFDVEKFNKTGVTNATLARFFLDEVLPRSTRRIVYIDGDTWVHTDPSRLIEAIVPEGRFAAAEDMISLRYNRWNPRGRLYISYLQDLGISIKRDGYFNAGVFAVSRQTWRTIAAEAFAFFRSNIEICKYHDQSALNAIMRGRRLRLSAKWNFQTPLRYLPIEERIKPSIHHFHSYPKPWMGPCEPWKDYFQAYETAFKPFEALQLPIKRMYAAEIEAHNNVNWRKSLLMKSPVVGNLALSYR